MVTSPGALFNIDLSFFSKLVSGAQSESVFTLELHRLDATPGLLVTTTQNSRAMVVFC
jgi:hypothetical protein